MGIRDEEDVGGYAILPRSDGRMSLARQGCVWPMTIARAVKKDAEFIPENGKSPEESESVDNVVVPSQSHDQIGTTFLE